MELPTYENKSSAVRYPKASVLMFQGEVPRYGFLVEEGCIKVYSIDNDGNQKVVGIYSKGDIFPADWLMGRSKSVMFYHETLEDSLLIPIQKADCNQPALQEHLNNFTLQETTGSLIRNLALQQSNSTNKILYFFFYLAVRHGTEKVGGIYSLGLPLTHQFIADNLGLTRETVAGEISKLKKANVVVYRRKHYIVDKALLIKTVGKEITSNFTD